MLTSLYAKIAGIVIVAVAIGGTALYARAMRAERDAVRLELGRAEENVHRLTVQILLQRDNAEVTRSLVENDAARENAKAPQIQTLIQEVYRDRPPTPKECDRVLDPLRDALAGVRRIQAGRAASGGSGPAAAAGLQAGPAAP